MQDPEELIRCHRQSVIRLFAYASLDRRLSTIANVGLLAKCEVGSKRLLDPAWSKCVAVQLARRTAEARRKTRDHLQSGTC